MNITINFDAQTSTPHFNTKLETLDDYRSYKNTNFEYDFNFQKNYTMNRIKRVNTTDFVRLSLLYNHKYHITNSTQTLHYANYTNDMMDSGWENITYILGTIRHYHEVIAYKILVNGLIKFVILDKTKKGGRFYSQTTSIYVNKLKRFCEYHKLDFFVKGFKTNPLVLEVVETEENCAILLDHLNPMIKTKCNHFFNKNALEEWLKISKLCPLCKGDLYKHLTPDYEGFKEWVKIADPLTLLNQFD